MVVGLRSAEGRGTTVEEATKAALAELELERTQVEVEVVSPGVRPLPGERMATGQAHVRVTELSEPTARARQLLADLLGHMGIAATVSVRLQRGADEEESREQTILDVTGDDLGLLIGWRGETLRALQTVVNLMAGSDEPQRPAVIVDVERYRGRREEQIRDLALRLAERVKRSGERYALEPMRAFERRVVHLALKDDEGVRTESVGKEPARKIVIHPTGQGKVEPRERYDRRDRRRGGDGGWRGAR